VSTETLPAGNPGEQPLPPKVGPYRIEKLLGAGGMGTVYHGIHEESEKEAAVKVLPSALAREPGFIARFEREIEALRKVKSPYIVELYESGQDENERWFYAMEYVPGETLTQRLGRERRIEWRDVIDMGVQICQALKSAHNCGVIHRDLKPSNLMLTHKDDVKLTDFGVAQIFAGGKLTVTGGVIGTAEYMSPEQAQGQRATKQSDIYSLGVVLYVMLTGRPPFLGRTALDIAQKHRFGQFDSPRRVVPEVPRWLDEVVCKCLSKKPEDRYPDAYVLSLRLEEIPKKVDLANQESFEIDGASPTAETMAGGPAVPESQRHELGATFVRDMMRAEIERSHTQSPVERLLDNTWVLLGLLVLVVLGGYWLYQSRKPDPEKLFADGVALMKTSEEVAPDSTDENRGISHSDWKRARRENFLPLLEIDEEAWGPKVQPYLDRIAVYEVEVEFEKTIRRGWEQPTSANVLEHEMAMALEALREGRLSETRDRLTLLKQLLIGNVEFAEESAAIDRILKTLPAPDEYIENPLREEMESRAIQLEKDGMGEEAKTLRETLKRLYPDS